MIQVLVFPDRQKVANPYLDLLTDDVEGVTFNDWSLRRAMSKVDILHVHWPETVWQEGSALRRLSRGCVFVLLLCLARLRGTKIVETVHNVAPHEDRRGLLSAGLRRSVSMLLNGIQVLDRSSIERLDSVRRRLPVNVVEHGHYEGSYPTIERPAGPPFGVFHVGFLRPYKGTEELIEVFSALDRVNWRLHIAGEVDEGERAKALRQLLIGESTTFVARFLDPKEVSEVAARCHLCVMPFRKVENSGSVLMALSLGLPVLAPDIGNLSAIRDRIGPEWVHLYEPPLTTSILAEAMINSEQRSPSARPNLAPLSWDSIKRDLLTAYRAVLQSPANTGAG